MLHSSSVIRIECARFFTRFYPISPLPKPFYTQLITSIVHEMCECAIILHTGAPMRYRCRPGTANARSAPSGERGRAIFPGRGTRDDGAMEQRLLMLVSHRMEVLGIPPYESTRAGDRTHAWSGRM